MARGGVYRVIAAMRLRILLLLASLLLSASALPADGTEQIGYVPLESPFDRAALLQGGYDVWHYEKNRAFVRADALERAQMGRDGLRFEPRYRSDSEYFAAIGYDDEAMRGGADAGAYTTYAELEAAMAALVEERPDLCLRFSMGKSVEGRELWALKISDNVSADEDEPEFLFTGCHHAREWISVEVPLYAAQQLVRTYDTDPQARRYVNGAEIFFVPMVNPDGHQFSVISTRLWRKNRRPNGDGTFGVDLNRNYAYGWGGPGASGVTSSDVYRGPSAFSEHETQRIRDFALSRPLVGEICFHSYGQLILWPWGNTTADAPDAAAFTRRGQAMAEAIRARHGKNYVPQQAADLYVASGGSIDWLYSERAVAAFAIELRGDQLAGTGFLLPESEILPTCEENYDAMRALMSEWVAESTGERWELR